MTNYWYWKKRCKMPEVNALEELPRGHWLPVRKAARVLNLTPQAIRYRYLRGALKAARVQGRVFVDVAGVSRKKE